VSWVDGEHDKARDALAQVRSDTSETDWAAITFAGKTGPQSQKLKFLGSGTGGTTQLKEHLEDDAITFALVRVTDKIDNSVTVKFIWVNWLGNNVPRMMKARLSTQLGGVENFIGQHHISHSCSAQNEISHSMIMEKVMGTSGSGSKVIDSTGQAQFRNQAVSAGATQGAGGRSARKADDDANFSDDCAVLLANVRSGDATWCAVTYENSGSPRLVPCGSGTGLVGELQQKLDDDKVVYGLVRKIEQIDDSQVVKFCYVKWIGPNIPHMQRAKIGTHAGTVRAFFHPHHVTLDSPDKPEVNDDHIMKLIRIASGTYEHTLESGHPRSRVEPKVEATRKVAEALPPVVTSQASTESIKRAPSVQSRGMGGVKQDDTPVSVEGGVIAFENESAIRDAIQAVRRDDTASDWCLVTYNAAKSKTLKFLASGNGGLAEMKAQLKDDIVGYGLIRMLEIIDSTEAVKFCFVDWRGENINRMQRANLGIHSGAVQQLFHPYHVDIQPTNQGEITQELIMQKIKNASGTAVHVL
jgi:hypothetical protein